MDGEIFDGPAVIVKFERCGKRSCVVVVLEYADRVVHSCSNNLLV